MLLLDHLMQEPDWVEEAFGGVSLMYREARLVLGHWAPLMVESLRLAQAFSRVALITDALEDLQRLLHPIHHDRLGIPDSQRQRQVFQAFELEILYDKAERRIEISATVSEAVADAFEKQKTLPKEGQLVLATDIAGARSVSRYHRPRIVEPVTLGT